MAESRSRSKSSPPSNFQGPPCLVCGTPVSVPKATMCLACIKKAEKQRRPRFPGGARTAFGTRVAKAVKCVRCGKEDYLAFKPKDPEKQMCRACTAETVGLDEHGDPRKPDPLVDITCPQCGRPARVPRAVVEKATEEEPALCQDCLMGFETKQGNKLKTAERRKSGVVLKRKSTPS